MKRNTLIGLIIAGICMIPVICVLLVGIIDGIWPWDKEVEYPLLSIILPKETEPTTDPAQEETGDTTEGTEGSEPVAQGGQQSGGNQQSGDGQQQTGDTQGTETTGPQSSTTGPANGELPDEGDITIEIQGSTPNEDTTGTDGAEDPTKATNEAGEYVQDITLDDLLNQIFGGGNSTESTGG